MKSYLQAMVYIVGIFQRTTTAFYADSVRFQMRMQFCGAVLHKSCGCFFIFLYGGSKKDTSFKGMLFYASELSDRDSFARILMITWSVWSEINRRTHGHQYITPNQLKEWTFFFYGEFKKVQSPEDDVLVGGDVSRLNGPEVEENNFSLLVDAAISAPNQMVGMEP